MTLAIKLADGCFVPRKSDPCRAKPGGGIARVSARRSGWTSDSIHEPVPGRTAERSTGEGGVLRKTKQKAHLSNDSSLEAE